MDYDFAFVLQNDRTRRRILEHARPTKDYMSYQNLNLAYGVEDKNRHYFLTMTYYMSQAIMRDGRDVNDVTYLFITPFGAFSVGYEDKLYGKDFGALHLPPLLRPLREAVQQAILCYEDPQKRAAFEDAFEAAHPDTSLYRYKQAMLDTWVLQK